MLPERKEEISRLVEEWQKRKGIADFVGAEEWECIVYIPVGDEEQCIPSEAEKEYRAKAEVLAQEVGVPLQELLVWDRLQMQDDFSEE